MTKYLIHEVAEMLNMSPEAIRYYEHIGLLRNLSGNAGNDLVFNNKDYNLLNFIRKSRIINFSVDEMIPKGSPGEKDIIDIEQDANNTCYEALFLLKEKASELDKEIQEGIEFKKKLSSVINKIENNIEIGEKCDINDLLEDLF